MSLDVENHAVYGARLGEANTFSMDAEETDEVLVEHGNGLAAIVTRDFRYRDYGNDDYTQIPTAVIDVTVTASGEHPITIIRKRGGETVEKTCFSLAA